MVPREKRVVVITGAARGLGRSLAQALHATGRYRLALTARGEALAAARRDPSLSGKDLAWFSLDVTDAPERENFVDEVAQHWGGVDVLVNNAGTMVRAVVEHLTDADHQEQFAVNYRAPLELARLVLPGMRARGRGHIINVSSVGGMMAMPTMGAYSASKFALEGASEALYYEVRPWNVHVTLVAPGFINSDGFTRVAYTSGSREASAHPSSPYHAHYEYMADFIAKVMRKVPSSPDSVAARVVRLLERRSPPLRLYGTFDATLFALMRRLLPRGLYHEILYRSLPGIRHWGPRDSP
jgi:NAD(P)-dependent dehydrogenase (short-subunit alcohol dehydrogenase family)